MAVRIHGTFGSWVIPRGASVLGRGTASDVRIDEPRLSRSHARFVLEANDLRVEDLGSRNGVLVDGRRIEGSCQLRHGQVVVCGPVVLMVSIDPTQPHPRQPMGGQDPATRRTSSKGDTEAMLDAVSIADRPSASSRGIDPGILAAVASPTGQIPGPMVDASRQSALQPAPMPGSLSSPLEAVRPQPKPPEQRPSTRRSSSSAGLEPPELAPNASGALEAPTPTRPEPVERILSGLIDGFAATGAAGLGMVIALLALAAALAQAGASAGEGALRLGGDPAGLGGVLLALLGPGGLGAGLALAPAAAAASPMAMGILVAGAAAGAMAAVGGFLLVLVVPTVVRGAPRAHRAHGLVLARTADGMPLGYGTALLRWILAALLCPLALPAVLLRRRAPHDLLCGVTVRRGG